MPVENLTANLERHYRVDAAGARIVANECIITAHGILLLPRQTNVVSCTNLMFLQPKGQALYGSHVHAFCRGDPTASVFDDILAQGALVDDYTLTRYEPDNIASIAQWLQLPTAKVDVIAIRSGWTANPLISGVSLSTVLQELGPYNYQIIYCSFCRNIFKDEVKSKLASAWEFYQSIGG